MSMHTSPVHFASSASLRPRAVPLSPHMHFHWKLKNSSLNIPLDNSAY